MLQTDPKMYEEEVNFFCSEDDRQEKDLELLLHCFPSFSLEDIASAYCKSDRDVDIAVDILSGLQKQDHSQEVHSDCAGSLKPRHSGNSGSEQVKTTGSGGTSELGESQIPNPSLKEEAVDCVQNNFERSKRSKNRKAPVSVGMVSSILGKGYVRPASFQSESASPTDQMRSVAKELGENSSGFANGAESVCDQSMGSNRRKCDEEFLFSMFGDGCCFDTDVIRDVFSYCEYDVQQAVDKLLHISNLAIEEEHALHSSGIDLVAGRKLKLTCHSYDEEMQVRTCCENALKLEGSEPSDASVEKNHLEREIVEALFNVPERSERLPKEPVRMKMIKKSKRVVQRCVEASPVESKVHLNEDTKNEYEEARISEYCALRKSVQQHWNAMRAYYESAAEAHSKGNLDQAKYLLEQGRFYKKKANELEDRSGKFFEASIEERQPDVTLDLHNHGKSNALRLLQFHLSSLSGIPSIEFLKVIAEPQSVPGSKRSLKQFITTFLDTEHVKWHEEESNPEVILVRLTDVERDKLSFADKY